MDSESTTAKASTSTVDEQEPIIQYIAIRADLKWPKGALIAQCCHASIAAIHLNYADADTVEYLRKLDQMHKVVVGVPTLDEMSQLNEALTKSNLKFKLWIEQPENVPTCIATKPYPKSAVASFFKNFKLFK